MQQITITIGRGQVGTDRLLSAKRWDDFKTDVEGVIEPIAGYETVVSSDGTGTWTDSGGKTYSEQNHVWIALVPERIGFDRASLVAWRGILGKLADKYDQDSIAFAWGDSELVERAPSLAKLAQEKSS